MADETAGSFRRRVLGLPLRVWLIFIVAFVIGFVITAVLWSIVAGRDVVAIVGDVLTFMTLVAAAVALRYAAQSARAALDTVEPMKAMAANLTDAAKLLDRIEERFAATAAIMEKNLQVAEERYERAIMPRPRLVSVKPGVATTEFVAEVLNAGGLASLSLFVVQRGNDLLAGGATLPSQGSADMRLTYRLTIQGGSTLQAKPLLTCAKDVEGRWWDCLLELRIDDLHTWSADQFHALSLPALSLEESPDGVSVRIGGGSP